MFRFCLCLSACLLVCPLGSPQWRRKYLQTLRIRPGPTKEAPGSPPARGPPGPAMPPATATPSEGSVQSSGRSVATDSVGAGGGADDFMYLEDDVFGWSNEVSYVVPLVCACWYHITYRGTASGWLAQAGLCLVSNRKTSSLRCARARVPAEGARCSDATQQSPKPCHEPQGLLLLLYHPINLCRVIVLVLV